MGTPLEAGERGEGGGGWLQALRVNLVLTLLLLYLVQEPTEQQ